MTPRPAPIMLSEWIPRLWGDDEPIFDDDAQIKIVLGAVMKHHNEAWDIEIADYH